MTTIPPERRVRAVKYKVFYSGWYIIEADSADDAITTDRDDAESESEEWENHSVEELRN